MSRKPFRTPDEELAIVLWLKGKTTQVEAARPARDKPDDERQLAEGVLSFRDRGD